VIGLWDGFCSSDNGRGSGVVAKVEQLTTTSLVSTISRVRTKDLKFLFSVGGFIERLCRKVKGVNNLQTIVEILVLDRSIIFFCGENASWEEGKQNP
jgi:hypothetical protein